MIRFPGDICCVWLMLGSSCNFKCSYCVEHIYKPDVGSGLDYKCLEFLKSVSVGNIVPCEIKFYGGEPLLYYKQIQSVVEALGSKFLYRIITNGSLLTREIVEFCNRHDVGVIVSWDGKGSVKSRGLDVFSVNKDNLLALNNLSIHTVFNKYSPVKETLYDVIHLDDEYYERTGRRLYFGCDMVYPYDENGNEVYDVNFIRLKGDIDFLFRQYLNGDRNNVLTHFVNRYYSLYKGYMLKDSFCLDVGDRRCAYGISSINLDLEGNLYSCHNDSVSVGNVDSDYGDYLKALLKKDVSMERITRCNNCNVVSLCRGGCKLIDKNGAYCNIMKAYYYPMLKWLEKLSVD